MYMKRLRILLLTLLLNSGLFFSCGSNLQSNETTSTNETATQQDTGEVEGGSLNTFFPKDQEGYRVVYNQEKDGFVQASLEKEGEEIATLAISDLNTNLGIKAKYSESTMQVASYPALSKGSKGTTILVGDRYQVSIRSKEDSFDENMRKVWFEKFDLAGLANLK